MYPAKVYIDTVDGLIVVQAIVHAKKYQYVVVGVHSKESGFENVWSYRVLEDRNFSDPPTAILHVPLKSLYTAIRAILHVITGGEISEFIAPIEHKEIGKEVAMKFMAAKNSGKPPYAIRIGSKKAADKQLEIIQNVVIRTKRASCVF